MFERQKIRTAVKPHRCERCQKIINVGTRYRVYIGRNKKGFYERKECYL